MSTSPPIVNLTGGGTIAGALTVTGAITPQGGIVPEPAGFTSFATGGAANLLNSSSGTSASTVAGRWAYASLYVPFTVTLTGLVAVAGTTGGTDEWIAALWSYTGGLIANSAPAGTLAPAANTKARFPFTAGPVVIGPGSYLAGIQSNGLTATVLTFANATEGFVTGTQAGVFGTVPAISSVSATYTAGTGPYMSTY